MAPAKKAASVDAKPVETTPHTVLSNLRHGGRHYNPGATVELSQEDAAFLIDRKVVEPAK